VASLGIVADLVVRGETDPLGKGSVLVGLLGEALLDSEGLVRRLSSRNNHNHKQKRKFG
jgi:hypothetical protein